MALPIFGGSCGRWLVTGDRAKDGQASWWGLAPVLCPQEFLCWPCAQQREWALQGGPAPGVCRGPVPVPAILPASIAEASASPQCSHRRLDQPRSASVAFTEAAERSLKLKGTEFPESQGKTRADFPQPQKAQPPAKQRHQQTETVYVAKTSFNAGFCAAQE